MCGILGSIGIEISEDHLLALRHRGPDGNGIERIPVAGHIVTLAHTRLSILDLSPAGRQPMRSQDGRWWLTFNGEIYNHLDLRKVLSIEFRGHSDTETLVELIAKEGLEQAVARLNGMFAFAALDLLEGKLYLVRDPFGIKPLYFSRQDRKFSFASEVGALKALGVVSSGVDVQALQLFMTLRYLPAPTTLWSSVNRLHPGHVLCVDVATGKSELSCYIKPVKTRFSGSIDDAVDAYQINLKAAINRQLLSDVPVGVLLSGGIDSALVAAMAKDLGRDLPCFSVGFGKGHPECELADAAETARVLGLPFSSVQVSPDMLMQSLPDIVRSVEEPLGTTSIMPMWYLVKKAREQATVVLTGQGTDEPWGGYRRYQVEMVHRMFPFASFWQGLRGLSGVAGALPEVLERGLRTLSVRGLQNRAVEACTLFSGAERKSLLGSDADGGASKLMQYWLGILDNGMAEPAERMMQMDARMNLADDLLLYGDKISMAVSLEARVPMLDVELMSFVESLPLQYRLALRRGKIVHKKMAERYLPSAIVHRKKKGFGVPFGAWSRGSWRQYIEECLLRPDAPHWAMLDRREVINLWNQHLKAAPDRSRQIFSLLMLALWWREQ